MNICTYNAYRKNMRIAHMIPATGYNVVLEGENGHYDLPIIAWVIVIDEAGNQSPGCIAVKVNEGFQELILDSDDNACGYCLAD